MNGERPQVNGQHPLNGATSTQHHQATEAKIARSSLTSNGPPIKPEPSEPYMNGVRLHEPNLPQTRALPNGLDQAPDEILHLVSREHYLPIASLINRRTQTTWSRLSSVLQDLAKFDVPVQQGPPGAPIKNQTRANLDKKDALLGFLKTEKEDFIKLLVLVEWGKKADQVAKTISLSQWLAQRRQAYWGATAGLAALKRDAVGFQVPNPDINTAGEILSTGKVSSFPDIGYHTPKPLSNSQIVALLKRLDRILSFRLSLLQALPSYLQNFSIHDGRATFIVSDEFEVDLSVLDESDEAPFRLVDFRFAFRPRPAVPDNLRSEIERLANDELISNGLDGCYQFLHELTLSNKLIEFHKQALELARGQWSRQMRVELLRRNLIIQYWVERTTSKSWLEIGINKGGPGSPSHIAVRWFREGKEVAEFEIGLDLANLSMESLISQIVAQHSCWILGSFYDRLAGLPFFKPEGLRVEQSSSDFHPEDCFLQIQISKSHEIAVAIDPITGNLRISPASEHASQLQSELARSKNLLQDFVPRLLNYRCVVAEAVVTNAISDTSWERLSAFRPTSSDLRTVLPGHITRLNFFRHPTWSNEYLCAITHGLDGDEMVILQQALDGEAVSFVGSHIVHREAIDFGQELDFESFETLANHASRLIVLHTFAKSLRMRAWKCHCPTRKAFEEEQSPHLLSFDIGKGLSESKDTDDFEASETVQLDYISLDTHLKAVKLSATVRSGADTSVLSRLSASNPDQQILFAPKDRQITFEVSSVVGKPLIDDIVAQVTRVHDLTTCIQIIQSLSTMRLASISMNAMTISYDIGDIKDQIMDVWFPTAERPARMEFRPVESNPHVQLAASLSRMLNDKAKRFPSRLKDAVSSLALTDPLISGLRDIERSLQSQTAEVPKAEDSKIQAHILVRQPTVFALQFFTRSKGQATPSGTQSRMLARFEILPQSHARNSWLVRPAMEEFNQYSKASFASPALQKKVKDEIFAKVTPDWIRLDSAAVCLADKPQALLQAIKQVMIDWVESGEQVLPAGSTAQAPLQPPVKAPQQAQAPPPQPAAAPLKNPNVNNRPNPKQGPGRPNQPSNGVNPQQQQRSRPGPGPGPGSGKLSQPASKKNNQDIITID